MRLKLYQVDAFTGTLFHGNPAGVCIMDHPLDKRLMQQIAMENNLSETAFAVKKANRYLIRWFTPETEVSLCGHATLATAHILFTQYHHPTEEIVFKSIHRGILKVKKEGPYLTLDFPADHIKKASPPKGLIRSIGKKPVEVWKGTTDYLLVYKTEQDIHTITPDYPFLKSVNVRGTIITAQGRKSDFGSPVPHTPHSSRTGHND